jgi:hypothetical protein
MAMLRDTHLSGLHDAPRPRWREVFQIVAEVARTSAYTERPPFDVLPKTWHGWKPGADAPNEAECGVAWDTEHWAEPDRTERRRRGIRRLTNRKFSTGKGAVRDGVIATWVLLEHVETGKTLLRVVWHMPASVEDPGGFSSKTKRVIAWQSALRGVRREMKDLIRLLNPDFVLCSADWNVNLLKRRWRALINAGVRGTGLQLCPPQVGTHGRRRAIDGHLARWDAEAIRVLGEVDPFDHRIISGRWQDHR